MIELQPAGILTQIGVFLLLGVIPGAITIVALVDVFRVPNSASFRAGSRLIWVVVILLLNCVGAGVYLFVGRPRRFN